MQITRNLGGRENVGVSRDELVGDALGDVFHGEAPVSLAGDLRMEDHLEQQVPELFAKMILIADLNGLDRFGGLLNQVLHQRPMGLLSIPGALVAQACHDADESFELR